MIQFNRFATTLGFLSIFMVQPVSARRLNQLDVATIAGGLDPGKMEHLGGGSRWIFIDKTGKASLRPGDLTGGRAVIVMPHHSGGKSIIVQGVRGKTGKTKDQVTQTDYLLPRGAVRPKFVRALTTNRTVSPEGFTISRSIEPGMFGTQRSLMTVFRLNGPGTGWKNTSRWGQKVPSMRDVSRQAASFMQKPTIRSRLTSFGRSILGRR